MGDSCGVLLTMVVVLAVASCSNHSPPSSARVSAALTTDGGTPTFGIDWPASGTIFYDSLYVIASLPDTDVNESYNSDGQLLVNGVGTYLGRITLRDGHYINGFYWDATAVPAGDYVLMVRNTLPNGVLTTTAPVTVTLRHTSVSLVGLTLNPQITAGGAPVTATVTLSGPAPAGGIEIPISATEQPKVLVPLRVIVPEGATTGAFTFTPLPTGKASQTTVLGTLRQTSKSDVLTVTATPGVATVVLPPNFLRTVSETSVTSVRVILNQTFPTDSVITLTASSSAITVPATITVPAGQTTATTVPISVAPVSSPIQAEIAATFPSNVTELAKVWVVPSTTITSFTVGPSPVPAGQPAVGTVTFSGPVPGEGAKVGISCFLSQRAFLDSTGRTAFSLNVPAGARNAQVSIPTTASDAGFDKLCQATFYGTPAPSQVDIVIVRNLPSGNALFDPALLVPACRTVGAACDTGGLVDGRDNLTGGPESHSPNTIGGSCADNPASAVPDLTYFHYHIGSSLDRLKVSTLDGSALAAGKVVRVDVTAWGYGNLDLFIAPDATNPVWTFVERVIGGGNYTKPIAFSRTLTLPSGSLQAIRGSFTFDNLPPQTCANGYWTDRDDLVFATDNGGPPTNIAPSVNAGADQTIYLPPTATLAGTITDDGLPGSPAALTTTWSQVSGPGIATFVDAASTNTSAQFSVAGTYTLRLTASDGALAAGDDVVVVVNPSAVPNAPPTVNAGVDQTIRLPGSAPLVGVVSDDGLPNPPGAVVTMWSLVSGPGAVTFADDHAAITTASFSVAGTYTLRLTASDGGESVGDSIVVAVAPVPPVNQSPVVGAGVDQAITLPNAATLTGVVNDDGLPNPPATSTVVWTQVSGPDAAVFATPNGVQTVVTFPMSGVYVFRLTASDGALPGSDDIAVTVAPVPPVNRPPVVGAGVDQSITLPRAATLTGVVNDDGLPNPPAAVSVLWTKISGPGTVTFASPTARVTTAVFSMAGTYTLRLSATDGVLTANDNVIVVVAAAIVNKAPVVNAGADQAAILPAAANLVGSVTDDGLPSPPALVTKSWSKVSGPGSVTFGSANATTTTVTFSTAGSYVLRLSATDGALSRSDDVTVIVTAPAVKVQYRASDLSASDNQIKPRFNLINTGTKAVALSRLKIRYWYSIDTVRAQTAHCDFAQVGCAKTTLGFTTVNPAHTGADRYVELGFTSAAGNLTVGAQTGEIQIRLNKNDFSKYDETNDYSYAKGPTINPPISFVDWTRVTLYQDGVRIWGVEP
jgi:hypothetical protein